MSLNTCQLNPEKFYRIFTSANDILDESNGQLTKTTDGKFSLNLMWRLIPDSKSKDVYYIVNNRTTHTMEFVKFTRTVKLSKLSHAKVQQWIMHNISDQYCSIITTTCCNNSLTSSAGATKNAQGFRLSTFNGSSNQWFRFEEYSIINCKCS